MKIRRFTVGIAALVAAALLTGAAFYTFLDINSWVAHTNEVLQKIAEGQTLFERAETAARGYLLTRDAQYLTTFNESREKANAAVSAILKLVADNPAQTTKAAAARDALERRWSELKEMVARDARAARGDLNAGLSRESVLQVRAAFANLNDEEQALLRRRTEYASVFAKVLSVFILLSAGLAFLLMWTSYQSLRVTLLANARQSGLLKSIFDSIDDAIFAVDDSRRVTHFNRACEQLMNVNFAEVNTLPKLGQVFGVPRDQSPTESALNGQAVTGYQMTISRGAGPREISLDSRPVLGPAGERLGALAVLRDVTDQRAIEREWAAAREAAIEASKMKSEFLAAMSHEIRTPMNGVIGMATLLEGTALAGEQLSYVKTIKSSAGSLVALINQILDHAKIESGKLVLEKHDFGLREMVDSVLDLFRYLATSKSVELQLEWGEGLPDYVHGDGSRLRQVLINLVGNALKFTEKGFVRLKVTSAGSAGHQLIFEVRDTGRGIAKDMQARLFERFSQAHPGERGGSGLGLMISRELVRAMGGEIGVESLEGVGSLFRFHVHVEPAITCPLPDAENSSVKLGGRVLVAEDQSVNQVVITKFLDLLGPECTVVRDGTEAVALHASGGYDLILMDCQMQPMDGYTATERIRTAEKTTGAHIPIVALTAEGSSGDRQRCLDAGMDDFLSKPIDLEKLKNVLQKFLHAKPVEFEVERLNRLRSLKSKGRSLVAELVDDFLAEGGRQVEELLRASRAGDHEQVSHLAHALKSAGQTLGLSAFGQLCQELEDAPDSPLKAQALQEAFLRGCAWLTRHKPAV